MTILRYYFDLLLSSARLAKAFAKAWYQLHTSTYDDLGPANGSLLNSKERQRFQHYYYGTTYLAVLFQEHLRYKPTWQERYLFTNLAALAGFFDDLADTVRMDNPGLDLENISPETYAHCTDPRRLSLHFLMNVCEGLPSEHLPEFRRLMLRVFNAEILGEQHHKTVDFKQLEHLTAEKGGSSVLLFRRLLAYPISADEYAVWYDFGYLIQLCDDIFDLWHDRQSGTATLATFYAQQNDIQGLNRHFQTLAEPLTRQLEQSPALYFLLAITRACLHHYTDLQKKHGTLPLGNRQAMVMDMARWRNRWRAAWELLRGPG